MSKIEDRDARTHLRALNEQASDLMAAEGIPQEFWPAQIIGPSRQAIESSTDEGANG